MSGCEGRTSCYHRLKKRRLLCGRTVDVNGEEFILDSPSDAMALALAPGTMVMNLSW